MDPSPHEPMFDVQVCPPPPPPPPPPANSPQVRVQRAFSFEELQSGAYFSSLDDSDLQFYRMYGQPVLIPSPDEVDANFVVHASPCDSYYSSKSYTLQDPLGELARASAPQAPPPAHDWHPVKQEAPEVRHMLPAVAPSHLF